MSGPDSKDDAVREIQDTTRAALNQLAASSQSAQGQIEQAARQAENAIQQAERVALQAKESDSATGQAQWLFRALSDQIDREFELIGSRVNWLMTSTAFLFTAMAVSVANFDHNNGFNPILSRLLEGVPKLGLILAATAFFGCVAADWVICRRKIARKKVESVS